MFIPCSRSDYGDRAWRCAENPIFLLRCNCLISLACLYRTDEATPLKEPEKVAGENKKTFPPH